MTRRLAILFAALLLGAGLAPPAFAEEGEGGGDNTAIAINKRDGASLFRFAFKIARVGGEVVDNNNLALAYSECESCRTTAIAIQIVLVTGDPNTVTPVNQAVAINYQCTLCETFAAAYQFVLFTDGPVRFTSDGKRELARIRWEIRRLAKEELSPAELQARLDPLIARLQRVLAEELVPVERDDGEDEDEDDDEPPVEEQPTTTTETTTTETATTETTTTETTTTETTTTSTP